MSTPLSSKFNPSYTPDMAFRPVMPGTYIARLVHAEANSESRWTKKGDGDDAFYYGKYVAEIIDGDFAGRKVYGLLTTKVNKYGGTQCHDLALATSNESQLEMCESHEDLLNVVNEILEGEPIVQITVDWEASLRGPDGKNDYTKKLRGASKWPTDDEGNPFHILRVDEGTYTAQAVITRLRAN